MCGLYKAMMEREEELAMKIFLFPSSVDHPCKWLESLGLHQKGMWRRKCSCYSNSPFGLLPVKTGHGDTWGGLDNDEYPRDSPFPSHLTDGISNPILLSGHLLNGMGNIQIVMVGPEVPTSSTTSGIESRVRVNLARGIYQEEATYLPSPHVIVALNCGLESNSSWVGALELIKSMGIPAFFTDQSEISCTKAKQVLRSSGLHITHPVTPNPFRSPVRHHGPSTNVPSYSNCFVLGVNM